MLVTFYPIKWGQGTGELEEDFSTKPGRKRGCILGLAEIQSCSKSSQDKCNRDFLCHQINPDKVEIFPFKSRIIQMTSINVRVG